MLEHFICFSGDFNYRFNEITTLNFNSRNVEKIRKRWTERVI